MENEKKPNKLLFGVGNIPLVSKPPVTPLLDSQRNNVSACNSSLEILSSGIQEINAHL